MCPRSAAGNRTPHAATAGRSVGGWGSLGINLEPHWGACQESGITFPGLCVCRLSIHIAPARCSNVISGGGKGVSERTCHSDDSRFWRTHSRSSRRHGISLSDGASAVRGRLAMLSHRASVRMIDYAHNPFPASVNCAARHSPACRTHRAHFSILAFTAPRSCRDGARPLPL
jgi:hypothetical protein